MAITFVAEAHAQSYYTGTVTVTKPTGTANNDLLIAVVGGTRSGSTPAGWSPLSSVAVPAAGSLGTVYVYYKIAASEGANYTFPHSATAFDAWASITAYRGVNTTTPVDTTDFAITAKSSTATYATASVTADGLQWAFTFAMQYTYGGASGGTWTDTGERADQNNYQSSESASYSVADSNGVVSAGPFTKTHTCSITTSGGACGTVLLNPAITAVTANAESTSAVATAYDATTVNDSVASAGQPSVTATANNTTTTKTLRVNAANVTAAAAANDATVIKAKTVSAGQPSSTATANSATLAITSTSDEPVDVNETERLDLFVDADIGSSVDDVAYLVASSSSADPGSLLDDGSAFEVAIIDKNDDDVGSSDDGIETVGFLEGDIIRVVSRH